MLPTACQSGLHERCATGCPAVGHPDPCSAESHCHSGRNHCGHHVSFLQAQLQGAGAPRSRPPHSPRQSALGIDQHGGTKPRTSGQGLGPVCRPVKGRPSPGPPSAPPCPLRPLQTFPLRANPHRLLRAFHLSSFWGTLLFLEGFYSILWKLAFAP